MVNILDHSSSHEQAVIALILEIQREEFGFDIDAAGQPDLSNVREFYQSGAGGFWVAMSGDVVVGTIALRDIGNGYGALRKMFVKATHRGREHGVAARLLATLLGSAKAKGLREVFLGTTEKFQAAHRFYEKNGFTLVAPHTLPSAFPRMAIDTRFYARALP